MADYLNNSDYFINNTSQSTVGDPYSIVPATLDNSLGLSITAAPTPQQATSINSFAAGNTSSSFWDPITNTFNAAVNGVESYWNALTQANLHAAQTGGAVVNPFTGQAATPARGPSSQTLMLAAIVAVGFILLVK